MATIVSAISMSHAPLVLGDPDAPPPQVKARMDAAAQRLADVLDASAPDVIVAVLDDHFENHFRKLMPTLSIGIADTHTGPAAQWLAALRLTQQHQLAGMPQLGEHLLRALIHDDFDVARAGSVEFGNNLMVPLKQLRPACDIPVVPVFINVFSPPLISTRRAYAFGEALRRALTSYSDELRVCVLATGGLSHWPPIWSDATGSDDAFLARMKRFQTEGLGVLEDDPDLLTDLGKYEMEMAASNQYPLNSDHPLINAEWDRRFLDALAKADFGYLFGLDYEGVQREAGHGGHEVLNWIALMGAVGGAPGTVVDYEAVTEWICGMAYVYHKVSP